MTEQEPPHDILAAEEFGIGTRDERVPPDPTGITEPHDVLAAEEFAMPAGDARAGQTSGPEPRTLVPLIVLSAFAALVVLLGRRRR